jgi:hypothetical protein
VISNVQTLNLRKQKYPVKMAANTEAVSGEENMQFQSPQTTKNVGVKSAHGQASAGTAIALQGVPGDQVRSEKLH